MEIIVQKYGGTSVNTEERREHIAKNAKDAIKNGASPVIVVSAMGRYPSPYATDTLLSLISEGCEDKRLADMIASCGEIISAVAVASQLKNAGVPAYALSGQQAGILTDSNFGEAEIKSIDPSRILALINEGYVPVVAGFQGADEQGSVTTTVTKEATYDAAGEITYTATFQNAAFATQTKTVATPKLERPAPTENPFTDVARGQYYYDAVLWAVSNEVTSGTSATTFSPDNGCTRAQVVTFLWRAAGQPKPTTDSNPFRDVKNGTYYYDAVLWAVEQGITAGTSTTTFSPDATCTRAQIVTFLWRFEGQPTPDSAANPFADVQLSAYFGKAVLWAVENGITNGTSATTFSPEATCTRAQVVTFLYRDMLN